ncbi:hypothetical protein DSM100238_0842 [Bifidobacterium apri]|uniref:Uncharacterized protein n=1 Tax=Bifidobacterium apri TaxID=1769423 RepID=A0A6A2V8X0_9BIFI|nr:hypothetical protein DSM100238_0842 [Bifidobacterium apri]
MLSDCPVDICGGANNQLIAWRRRGKPERLRRLWWSVVVFRVGSYATSGCLAGYPIAV